jgi:hypothetical protein
MHLHEFMDYRPYIAAIDEADKFPDLLERMWPTNHVESAPKVRTPQQGLGPKRQSRGLNPQSPLGCHSVRSP